eukprot:745810-Hanusia_phi.AAC.3
MKNNPPVIRIIAAGPAARGPAETVNRSSSPSLRARYRVVPAPVPAYGTGHAHDDPRAGAGPGRAPRCGMAVGSSDGDPITVCHHPAIIMASDGIMAC